MNIYENMYVMFLTEKCMYQFSLQTKMYTDGFKIKLYSTKEIQ